MKIDKTKVRKRFNRAVATFDNYAVLHRKMAQRLLLSMQKQLQPPDQILEIGCGTGYFTQLLLDFYPEATITAIDFAEKMIGAAKENIGSEDRIRFIVADAEELLESDGQAYDLIVSNATFHLLQRPEETLHHCMQRLNAGGWFVASTFGPDTLYEFTGLFAQVEEEMGLGPSRPIMDFHSPQELEHRLREESFAKILMEEHWQRLEYEDCSHFLRSIRSTGNSYNEADQSFFLLRQVLDQVKEKYDRSFQTGLGVYATYHMMDILAQKSETAYLSPSW